LFQLFCFQLFCFSFIFDLTIKTSSKLSSMSASLNSKKVHLTLGQKGEAFAAAYLEQCGYRLVAANFKLPIGRNRQAAVITAELDLIAYDENVLCFVEVKTRASDWFATPEVNVDRRKRRQIARAARAYRQMFALDDLPYRYDVVSVILRESDRDTPEIELLKNFWREEQLRKRRWNEYFYD
jgi:putative endonuclease